MAKLNLCFYTLFVLYLVAFLGHNFKLCFCFNPKHVNLSPIATHWATAGATWYGNPDGGSCGYGKAVSQAPFSSLVTGIGPSLYNSGKECGACYQIKCTKHPSCSGKPVRVVITDVCPGCTSESAHFDLSGTSFGAMAVAGQQEKLRAAGTFEIQYARVACDYSGKTITFQVDSGSNPTYFATVIEFEDGDGDLAGVELKEEGSSGGVESWRAMQQSWGAVWKLDNYGQQLHPPFSIRLTSQYSDQTIVAKNVVPDGWKPNATYRSLVNYGL
ncbi:hypothetical protein HS088_TW08G00196 [Tripterygium wilfordii]|uniref:Uncharacterized protein n=1 Tax=Tripterygium wilfordii TaxID=458696 RepID=A0A7J7DBC6_TRIWF|nr:hypothetical protein HS088_TW08G00196 [Tripterygium wilfordii]